MHQYIPKLRAKIGTDKFIHPAARIIIEDDAGQILLIERMDNGQLGIPAGAFEENETITECIIREVREETGLLIRNPILIGLSTNPDLESVEYANGDQIQYFTAEFYANEWSGELRPQDKEEVKSAKFVPFDLVKKLPKNEFSAVESLEWFRKYGQPMIK